MKVFLILAFTVALSSCQKDFQCPNEKYAVYPDEEQCDKYYVCEFGEYEEFLCEDGLRFDSRIRRFNQCDLPISVQCGTRTKLQPAQSNHFCPRKNGYFQHPDPRFCRVYYNCIQGDPKENTCAAGLHFAENLGICVWENNSNRTGCIEPDLSLEDGFNCTDKPKEDRFGVAIAHPVYSHPTDCQKFYVCLNGIEPRLLQCNDGEVFNEDNGRCDDPEQVELCADWYKEDDDDLPAAKPKPKPKQRRRRSL